MKNIKVCYKQSNQWYSCRVHRLSWHDGTLPEDEIWLKIGGDKGGGSFKMAFQICNVPHPNSPDNTCAFCVFEAADNVTNLHIALDRYKEQIDRIASQTWRYECVSCSYICDKHQRYKLIIFDSQREEDQSVPLWRLRAPHSDVWLVWCQW